MDPDRRFLSADDVEIVVSPKILVLDDDENLLASLARVHGNRYDLTMSSSGEKALEIVREQGPFGVVISDLRMPEMDGIEFLSHVRESSPNTVRMILTGYADLNAAIDAVNNGQVFRFLTKPISARALGGALDAGLEQHRLIMASEANLVERERRFRTAIAELPLPVMFHAEDGEVLLINHVWTEISGYPQDEIPDINAWTNLAFGPRQDEIKSQIKQIYQKVGKTEEGEVEINTKKGSKRVWDFRSAPMGELPDGRRAVVSIASDVTERKSMEESLKLAGRVFESTTNGIMITDPQGQILDVNPALSEMTGFARGDMLGQNPSIFKSGRHEQGFYQGLWRSLVQTGSWRGEIWNRRQDGEVFPCWETVSVVKGPGGETTNYVAVMSDLSALKDVEEQLEYLSRNDPLTGLPNRVTLRDRLVHSLSYAKMNEQAVVLLYLDLDHFKLINESLGHQRGDQLLIKVSERLKENIREIDTLIRWSGDHFAIAMVDDLETTEAALTAQRILEGFKEPFDLDGHRVFVSASIGLAVHPADAGDENELIQHGDTAMNAAKEDGRNRYKFFASHMNAKVTERLNLNVEMRTALENREFRLHYQPRLDLTSGRVQGMEALIRWQHPSRGLVPPDKFLPAAEESDLIVQIGSWVLKEACGQAQKWLAQGLEIGRVAVNLSGRQFWDEDLVEMVAGTLKEFDLPTSRLELEVTESVVMSNVENASRILSELVEMGIETSLDDFGTGYSSLYYLKKLPLHILKIDKSFVGELPHSLDDATIVETIANLGHSFGLKLVVEGVETKDQLEFVRELGCELVQGYYFSRPLPPDELASFLTK